MTIMSSFFSRKICHPLPSAPPRHTDDDGEKKLTMSHIIDVCLCIIFCSMVMNFAFVIAQNIAFVRLPYLVYFQQTDLF